MTPPNEIFTAEDFKLTSENGHHYLPEWSEAVAQIANRIFQSWLEKQVRVYGIAPPNDDGWTEQPSMRDTHQARLVAIEPIGENDVHK